MDTKEAIWYFKNYEDYDKHIFRENIDCILKALQCGEKYEQMWKELDTIYVTGNIPKVPNEKLGIMFGAIRYIMDTIKQKYFPKGGK